MYYFQGLTISLIAQYYDKSKKQISRWIVKYEAGDGVDRV